jgi:hypothetical protein
MIIANHLCFLCLWLRFTADADLDSGLGSGSALVHPAMGLALDFHSESDSALESDFRLESGSAVATGFHPESGSALAMGFHPESDSALAPDLGSPLDSATESASAPDSQSGSATQSDWLPQFL